VNTIGERIVFLRENLDLRQIKLAEMIGITKMTLYKYERNLCEPRGEIIARLADALNTTADFLVGRTNDYAPSVKDEESEEILCKENQLLSKLRHLTPENQAKIEERIDIFLETQD